MYSNILKKEILRRCKFIVFYIWGNLSLQWSLEHLPKNNLPSKKSVQIHVLLSVKFPDCHVFPSESQRMLRHEQHNSSYSCSLLLFVCNSLLQEWLPVVDQLKRWAAWVHRDSYRRLWTESSTLWARPRLTYHPAK